MTKPINGTAVSAAKANAAEAKLRPAFPGGSNAPKLARLKAARTKGEYVEAYCDLHGVTLADVQRVRL